MNALVNNIKAYWLKLESRERMMLGWGSFVVGGILFYALLWQPWQRAITHLETVAQPLRTNLVWMRQQSELLANGGVAVRPEKQGVNESLMSILEKTALQNKVRDAIQQLVPTQDGNQVRVVLEEANFNQWARWVDSLFKQYGVNIDQVTAERSDDKPNVAEIRVTFVR